MKQQGQVFILYRLRHLLALARRAADSFAARGVTPTLQIIARRLFPTRQRAHTLELYQDLGTERKVRLPGGAPVASIVIPAHNQLQFTLRCLHSLARSGDATPFEVIVVDDASTDESPEVLPGIEGLRYLRNAENRGFIDSSNAGAGLARGEFVVLLNNDTIVQPGWLDALLGTFLLHPDTGLAGSKLVYPDGRLQEAGGIVFSDGSAANHGRGGDPADPRYNFVREVDYCSGAALAIHTSVWRELGGFDPIYRPAYYEDTDLAMRVRQRGLKVRYQPASVVVHVEGVSSGTDVNAGVKAYQAINKEKFLQRWAKVLAKQHPAPRAYDGSGIGAWLAASHRSRARILVIDSYTPTPDRDSGSLRLIELMRLLVGENCAVAFFSQSATHADGYTEALQAFGIEACWRPWMRSIPAWLRQHGPHLDAIIVSRHYVLSPLLPLLRKLAPQAQIVFDTVDLHFLREQRESDQSASEATRLKAERTRATELRLMSEADRTWVVSAVERDLLATLAPAIKVDVVSNIHRVTDNSPGFGERHGLLFVGSFRHPPNVDAVCWLVDEILPLVLRELPMVRVSLVGADAPPSVLALQDRPGVDMLGQVADLDTLLDRTRISLAPLRFGAGIKGKINQSLARGLPVVATPGAVEGMFLQDGEGALSAESASDFADAIVRLYGDPDLWQRLRCSGLENTLRHFSREAAQAQLRPWLDQLKASRAPAASARR